MTHLVTDLRQALRGLGRAPGFALAAILTLALGIGANAAVFSVVNAVLLRPLPYADADRMAYLAWDWGLNESVLSPMKYGFFREHATSLAGVSTVRSSRGLLGRDESAPELRGLYVDDAFFRVFAVTPALGRSFAADEHVEAGGDVIVLGHEVWMDRFAGDPGILGRTITLRDATYTVVGVMPRGFRYIEAEGFDDYLLPFRLTIDPRDKGHNYVAHVRLVDGVTYERVDAELAALSARFRSEHPDHVQSNAPENERMVLTDYASLFVADLQRTLWVLLGAVGFVLLIACANVANLLLVRGSDRRREIAIRTALGAGRGRILGQLLTESMLLAGIAGVIGVLAGVWTVDGLLALMPQGLPRAEGIGLDRRVFGFALMISAATGVTFGLAAALPMLRSHLVGILREGDRGAPAGPGARRVRNVLVVAETAIACVLLAGASLLIASFTKLSGVDPGFRTEGIVAASFARIPTTMDAPALQQFQERALERFRQHPAVHAAASTANLPLERGLNIPVTVVGRPDATEGAVEWRAVSTAYFDVLDVATRAGRVFDERDDTRGAPVVIINESYARHYFQDADPVGRQIHIGAFQGEQIPGMNDPPRTIIGVVADVKEIGLGAPARRTVFVPHAQVTPDNAPHFLLRTDRTAEVMTAARDVFRAADPRMPPPSLRLLTDIAGASIAQERFNTVLMAIFAALALVLTAVGLYGVLSYTVRQRTREIGIRMALGARRIEVLRIIVGQGISLALAGLAIGIAAALWLTRLLQSMLFDVRPSAPLAYLFVALLLVLIAAIASYLPARRAMNVPPIVALRQE